jgi:hypothetical protein
MLDFRHYSFAPLLRWFCHFNRVRLEQPSFSVGGLFAHQEEQELHGAELMARPPTELQRQHQPFSTSMMRNPSGSGGYGGSGAASLGAASSVPPSASSLFTPVRPPVGRFNEGQEEGQFDSQYGEQVLGSHASNYGPAASAHPSVRTGDPSAYGASVSSDYSSAATPQHQSSLQPTPSRWTAFVEDEDPAIAARAKRQHNALVARVFKH